MGPFPHRKYLEDTKQIYISCIKMKSIIDNFINGEIIDNTLKSNEDIIRAKTLIENLITSLDFKEKENITFNKVKYNPKLKINKKIINDLIRKIFISTLKIDNNCKFEISLVEDYLDQMIFVFHPISININRANLLNILNQDRINENLEKHGYNLEISFKDDGSCLILLYIPNYRVVKDGNNQ